MTRPLALSVLSTLALVGCGGTDDGDRPATHPVSGIVKLNGNPVEGANVTFAPPNPQQGNGAFGVTDAEGRYKLMTFRPGDGAVAGEYKVAITKLEKPAAPAGDDDSDERDNSTARPKPPKHLLPKKYSSATTSGLTASVTDGGENQFNFDLEE